MLLKAVVNCVGCDCMVKTLRWARIFEGKKEGNVLWSMRCLYCGRLWQNMSSLNIGHLAQTAMQKEKK